MAAPAARKSRTNADSQPSDADLEPWERGVGPRYSESWQRAFAKAMTEDWKARGVEFEPHEVQLTPEGYLIDDNPYDQPIAPSRHPRCKLTERELYEALRPHLDSRGMEFEYVDDGDPPSFDIGQRPVFRYDEEGYADLVDYVPMNRDDALYPREGDEIMGSYFHALAITLLFNMARFRLGNDPTFRCYTDTRINVGIIGHRAIKPDLAVMTGAVRQSSSHLGTFYLEREPNPDFRCLLAVEVTSPKSTRRNDLLIKRGIYADAGFEQYVVVDIHPETKKNPNRVELLDMRANEHVYMDPLPPRKSGRIPILGLGVWLGLENGELVVYESERGKRINDYPDAMKAGKRAERRALRERRRAEAAEAQAEAEKNRANTEKDRADGLASQLEQAQAELRRLRGES